MVAGQPERVQGGQWPANGRLQGSQNACRALAVDCQWPGSGLAVAWQPGGGWSSEVGGTLELPGRQALIAFFLIDNSAWWVRQGPGSMQKWHYAYCNAYGNVMHINSTT